MEELFGELRSLLHTLDRSEEAMEELFALLTLAREHDPGAYERVWRPYLEETFEGEWPPMTVRVEHEVEAWLERAALVPGMRVRLAPYELRPGIAKRLGWAPGVASLTELTDRDDWGRSTKSSDHEALEAALANPHLRGLRAVELTYPSQAACERLLQPDMHTLEHIEIRGGRFQGLLGQAPWVRVHTLRLIEAGLGPDDIHALSCALTAPTLRTLSLEYNDLGPEGAAHLARWAGLSHLRELDLYVCRIYADGARALAGSKHLGRLMALGLRENGIGPDGAQALYRSKYLSEGVRSWFRNPEHFYEVIWE